MKSPKCTNPKSGQKMGGQSTDLFFLRQFLKNEVEMKISSISSNRHTGRFQHE